MEAQAPVPPQPVACPRNGSEKLQAVWREKAFVHGSPQTKWMFSTFTCPPRSPAISRRKMQSILPRRPARSWAAARPFILCPLPAYRWRTRPHRTRRSDGCLFVRHASCSIRKSKNSPLHLERGVFDDCTVRECGAKPVTLRAHYGVLRTWLVLVRTLGQATSVSTAPGV